ncbi:PadR family transcriptional regulator [Aciditerrimonas ferrireducens]|uniref:PadR family transcriptional regulator n=1 Tax=Aciditerrimonas ferrireducens TaxID=667306 RepID=A0ABV6C3H3_9ACTN
MGIGGPGPWAGGPGGFGPGGFGPGGFGPGGRRRGRRGRGDVRHAVLALLAERPMHGYEMIAELEERTGGLWRPSPGSVYPTLQLLEDEGLVQAEEEEGRRRYSLTAEGERKAAEVLEAGAPWARLRDAVGGPRLALRHAAATTLAAARQVALVGDEHQQEQAVAILEEARQRLYRLLGGEAAGGTP